MKDFLRSGRQKERRESKLSWVFWIVLVVVAVAAFLGLKSSVWNGQNRITVVSLDPVEIVSYNPGDGLVVVALPESLMVDVAQGYGQYRVDKLNLLDQQEKKRGRLLQKTVQQFFGVRVYGLVEGAGGKANWFSGRLSLATNVLLGRIRFSLGFWDTLRFVFLVGGARTSDVEMVDLSTLGLLRAQTQPDGNVVLDLNQDGWDGWVRKNIFDGRVDAEGLAVAVVNATSHQGLGSAVARLVENLGGRVVQVRNDESLLDTCIVQSAKDLEFSTTVVQLKALLGCGWSQGETAAERAEVVVLLGEDYWRQTMGRS